MYLERHGSKILWLGGTLGVSNDACEPLEKFCIADCLEMVFKHLLKLQAPEKRIY